jgi:hypothetical protein
MADLGRPAAPPWERRAREREVFWQRVGVLLALPSLMVGVVTAGAAVWAALQATEAVNTAQDAVLRASREQRMTSGIEAMGGRTAAQRVAGIGLLGRSVAAELERVRSDSGVNGERERRDAVAAYLSTLDALEDYVVSWPDNTPEGRRRARVGHVPRDVYYAANELNRLTGDEVRAWAAADDAVPRIDLSGAHLSGASLKGLDVSWLTFFARRLDLRKASLEGTRWGTAMMGGSDLRQANLQGASFAPPVGAELPAGTGLVCSDLRSADLSDVDLGGADLRGAMLEHADLTGADLTGAKLWGADLDNAEVEPTQLASALGVGLGAGEGRRPGRFSASDFVACLDRVSPNF